MEHLLYGGIEAGGTKFVCTVGYDPEHILAETRFPTTTPKETLNQAVAFFQEQMQRTPLEAIGVAAFGPLDLDLNSPNYGHIASTPKPGWSGADIIGPLKAGLKIPIGLDTDVNGAALGEHRWGAAQELDNFVYLTIGTGIGGGAMVNGQMLHGLLHPEMGHFMMARDSENDPFVGHCPFHGDCFEGLASGPAIEARWGQKAQTLSPEHPAWKLEVHYIAQAVHALVTILSPQRIILGGGVMEQKHLFPMIRQETIASLNGYVQHSAILEKIDTFIVPPGLGNKAGMLGAIVLAQQA